MRRSPAALRGHVVRHGDLTQVLLAAAQDDVAVAVAAGFEDGGHAHLGRAHEGMRRACRQDRIGSGSDNLDRLHEVLNGGARVGRSGMGQLRAGWAVLAVCGLAACGGGGGERERETLYVSFGYINANVSVRQAVTMEPSIAGLGARQPICALSSGALPPGVVLSTNCVIAGAATAPGTYSFTVRLTSNGVEGFVETTAQVMVDDPTPALASTNGNDQGLPGKWRMTLGDTWTGGAITQVSAYAPQAGDVLTYRVASGSLPAGLALSPSNGTIGGAAAAFGSTAMTIALTLRRNGVDYVTPVAPITINVVEPSLGLAYGSCDASWAVLISCLPTTTAPPIAGATLAFSSSSLPPGFSLNAITGELSGTPATILRLLVPITATWTLPDGRINIVSVDVNLSTAGLAPVYAASGAVTGVASGPLPSPDGLGGNVVGLVAGQTFSIPIDRIAGARTGDAYAYELVQMDPAFVLPAWITVDAQGTLRGTPPAGAVGVPQYWTLRFTTQRSGLTLVLRQNWAATVQ